MKKRKSEVRQFIGLQYVINQKGRCPGWCGSMDCVLAKKAVVPFFQTDQHYFLNCNTSLLMVGFSLQQPSGLKMFKYICPSNSLKT